MTMAEKNAAINLYATWNKSTLSRAEKVQSHYENLYRNTPLNSNNEKYSSDSLLKEKMCLSKKYNHPSDQSTFPLLQKPRVYTYDDRARSNQQPNIPTSSSGSSSLSWKDRTLKETKYSKSFFDSLLSFFYSRSYSIQDGSNVIGRARGIIDYYGGKLSCPLTGVSLHVPIGAIPEGIEQEIYFEVCHNSSQIENFHGQLLSPIVICGPQGLQFDKPVELTLPHSAGKDAQQLSLMLHGTNQSINVHWKSINRS